MELLHLSYLDSYGLHGDTFCRACADGETEPALFYGCEITSRRPATESERKDGCAFCRASGRVLS